MSCNGLTTVPHSLCYLWGGGRGVRDEGLNLSLGRRGRGRVVVLDLQNILVVVFVSHFPTLFLIDSKLN